MEEQGGVSQTAAEMAEQPAALTGLLARRAEIRAAVRAALPRPPVGIVLVARGSSDHAAAAGRYALELSSGRPTALGTPSLVSRYGAAIDFGGFLVVALSQSGHTPEIVNYLERARAGGAVGLAITNDPGSPLAAVADVTIDLACGPELAVPATKTVTAELLALTLLAEALGRPPAAADDLAALPDQVAAVLADPEPARTVAARLLDSPRLLTVARGPLLGAALETALKIEEITGLMVAAHSAADFRHGPIAIADPSLAAIALASPGPTEADVLDLVARLRDRGCAVHLGGPYPEAALDWPAAPEILAPVLAVVRGQQVAAALAELLDRDPDRPAGLTKVTAT